MKSKLFLEKCQNTSLPKIQYNMSGIFVKVSIAFARESEFSGHYAKEKLPSHRINTASTATSNKISSISPPLQKEIR